MRTVRITLRAIAIVFVLGLLHYVLPQHDVAKINSTEIIRMDFSSFNRLFFAQSDSGSNELETRDVRLISTERKKSFLLGFVRRDAEGFMVYRNEDTGFIWPPYFKFDSSDVQAAASANLSTAANEQWVVITHYGWRNRFFTIYPNVVGIKAVDGPDVTIIPWANIIFFSVVAFLYFFGRAMWRQFRERKLDPVLDDASDTYAKVSDSVNARRGRISRWLDTWKSKPPR